MTMPITIGLEFKSQHFTQTARVSAIRETEVDLILISSEGHGQELKGCSLAHAKNMFAQGVYYIPEKVNEISMISI